MNFKMYYFLFMIVPILHLLVFQISRLNTNLSLDCLIKFKSNNILVLGVEGQDTSDWILIDCEDLVVNIMNNETRVYSDLETLWGYEDATLNSNL